MCQGSLCATALVAAASAADSAADSARRWMTAAAACAASSCTRHPARSPPERKALQRQTPSACAAIARLRDSPCCTPWRTTCWNTNSKLSTHNVPASTSQATAKGVASDPGHRRQFCRRRATAPTGIGICQAFCRGFIANRPVRPRVARVNEADAARAACGAPSAQGRTQRRSSPTARVQTTAAGSAALCSGDWLLHPRALAKRLEAPLRVGNQRSSWRNFFDQQGPTQRSRYCAITGVWAGSLGSGALPVFVLSFIKRTGSLDRSRTVRPRP